MYVKSLQFKLQDWGENKGKYEGIAEFASEQGSVSIRITPEHAHRILEICSDSIIVEADKVAKAMVAPLIEAVAPPPEFIRIKAGEQS